MFKWRKTTEKTGLEKAQDQALVELATFSPEDPQYEKIMKHVKTLSKLIEAEKPDKRERLSPNTIALIVGNAVVGLLVVGYEKENVVTSKVQTFMLKFK